MVQCEEAGEFMSCDGCTHSNPHDALPVPAPNGEDHIECASFKSQCIADGQKVNVQCTHYNN